MKQAIVVLVFTALVVAAFPTQKWMQFERTETFGKTASRLGDIYTFCNKTVEPLVISSVAIKPDPPVEGQDLSIDVQYTLREEITGGSVAVEVKVDGLPLIKTTYSVCDVVKEVGMSCPIEPFAGHNATTVKLPKIGGHVTVSASATDQNNNEILCVDIDVHL